MSVAAEVEFLVLEEVGHSDVFLHKGVDFIFK